MNKRTVDHRPPVETALVLHPVRPGAEAARDPEARLAEARGLAEALDLRIKQADAVPLRAPV
ncbi:MAG TPA: GTPase HflX, partial [Caulobacteraceae bacterium]|nr:GTPase HflX [Caulobacteraceae bacterium]